MLIPINVVFQALIAINLYFLYELLNKKETIASVVCPSPPLAPVNDFVKLKVNLFVAGLYELNAVGLPDEPPAATFLFEKSLANALVTY